MARKLPGSSFNPNNVVRGEFVYDVNGNLLLSPGDYVIPVMTYCMKQAGTSPNGHIYSLSKLAGTRAAMIRELNLKAAPKFRIEDIQIVSWSLQAGLSYNEMTEFSQNIIDEVIPQFKHKMTESFLTLLERKWNQASSISQGVLPTFNNSFNNLADELGEIGKKIAELRKFKERLHEVGHDYSKLSELIEVPLNFNKKEFSENAWSQISTNIYARFVTKGHYQQIGFVQIRVVTEGQKREVNSIHSKKITVDLVSWLASPNMIDIQPLSFSPLYGYAGVIATPALLDSPMAAALLLAAILTAKSIDWDAFLKLYNLFKDSKIPQVQKELEKGIYALQVAHDELEKPLKDAGIISGKTKDTSTDKENETREYQKDGGDEELQNDFDKLPGKHSKASDGIEYKNLPNGNKAVKRPAEGTKPATLEIQPSKNDIKSNSRLRIKVRYL